MTENIPIRIASGLLNSLKGGVVPRVGLPYISVGRKEEIDSLLLDIQTISEGGAAFRFIEGRYGSGKSFLLQMMKTYALDKGFVVLDSDLSPSRRFIGNNDQGLATYKELVKNMSTKTKPEGGALSLILQKWMNKLELEIMNEYSITKESKDFNSYFEIKVYNTINKISEDVNGFDFAKILLIYYKAYKCSDNEKINNVIRYLRGEYRLKSDVKKDLGISSIITDSNYYDYLKLLASFLKEAGYKGTLILIDELVNLFKIPNSQTRNQNYEMILMMYNECLQGKCHNLGFIMSGTKEAICDERKGLYSYEALKSRLNNSRFTTNDVRDIMAPVIKLKPLTQEEVLVLLSKLSIIHGKLYSYEVKLTDRDIESFIKIEYGRIGSNSLITVREIIRDFIEVLNILFQYPNKTIESIIKVDNFKFSESMEFGNDEFQEFTL